jgi:probable rRNA maturation factor
VNVFLGDEQDEPVDGPGLRRFAEIVLEAEGLPGSTEVAVVLVGTEQMEEYNRRFMERAGPTDVLAFPLLDLVPGSVPALPSDDPPMALGDVFLCPAEIREHAREDGVPFDDYLYLLLAHGLLHLLGYDHHDEETARQMEQREEELLDLMPRPR